MKKYYRQFLLMLSILVFLVVSPIMVFYALGYRFSANVKESKPVGVLIVESVPRRADVYINDQHVGKTPHSVANLSPETITLAVAKEGMVTWQKRIAIASGVVTEARDIRLFPETKNIRTMASNVNSFSLSPNRKLVAVTTNDNQFLVLDGDGIEIAKPITLTTIPERLLWSPDSSFIIFSTRNKVSVVDITKTPLLPSPVSKLDKTTKLTWDQRIPGRLHAITNENDLISYNLATSAIEVIASKVKFFTTSSRHIYVVDFENQLRVFNLQGVLVDSPYIAHEKDIKELHVTPGEQIVILFADNSLSYLTDEKELVPLAESVQRLGWSPDEQLLYLQTDDTSLHVINMRDERLSYVPLEQLHLVIRLSRPIRNPQWFAGGRHLIYQADDEVFITEIDTRDHPISYVVDSTNLGDSQITVGDQGNNVFYIKKTGQQSRLVSASLTVDTEAP